MDKLLASKREKWTRALSNARWARQPSGILTLEDRGDRDP